MNATIIEIHSNALGAVCQGRTQSVVAFHKRLQGLVGESHSQSSRIVEFTLDAFTFNQVMNYPGGDWNAEHDPGKEYFLVGSRLLHGVGLGVDHRGGLSQISFRCLAILLVGADAA